MLRVTELCLVCATIVAFAQNKLRVYQLQAVGPGLVTKTHPTSLFVLSTLYFRHYRHTIFLAHQPYAGHVIVASAAL